MAIATFDEQQIEDICEALEINSILFNQHLTYYASYITDVKVAKTVTLLDQFSTARTKYVDVDPNDKNFGARIRSEKEKDDIKNKLASTLFLDQAKWYCSNSSNEFEIERG